MTAAASVVPRDFECVRECARRGEVRNHQCNQLPGSPPTRCICDKPKVLQFAVECIKEYCPNDVPLAREYLGKLCRGTQIPGL
ncbi:hypothetical protein BOTBODRAFT_34304 [Botryobasidium botryosum FD-172 SS1]|uniref:Uncharacterized protein n=1 Tax=Botryobasidium botryosum (strain FD-172 SS1) TaxID=930990 RepID=A0A067M9W9_BOTB1|nr:hypothetical protein BOTBODRAFT_34304 [Botryobasidium botryosum FD-172 SS1]